jgi:hypothetical protein
MESELQLANLVVSEYKPSLLERWGVRYFTIWEKSLVHQSYKI